MTAGTPFRPNDRPGRRLAWWSMLLVVSTASCSTISERTQPLVPTRHQVRTGGFILFSNFPLKEDPPVVSVLEALERDLAQHLDFRPRVDDDPVEIYVLDDKSSFIHFLKFYYPELPPRRAFFLAQGNQRVVYTYASARLEEDLRHEATHALLRGTYGDLPLWLDEGLAEYFESDLSRPGALAQRMGPISVDLQNGWRPNLTRLESLTDIREMTPRDYRESWAWVHLLLNAAQPGRSVLLSSLASLKAKPGPLGLTEKGATSPRLLEHLRELQSLPTHVEAAEGDRHTVRLQDKAADAAQATASARPQVRGFWQRVRGWVGM